MRGDDAVIKFALRVVLQGAGDEAVADIRDPVGCRVVIQANEVRQFHLPAGFFKSLAQSGFEQALIFLEMTCGLVENCPAVVGFFNHQEKTVFFNDSCNGAVGKPDHLRAGEWVVC